jgi:hypothetical protein
MDSNVLAGMIEIVAREKLDVHGIVVGRHGYVVAEAYFHPYSGEIPHELMSVTKSFTGALAGTATGEGKIAFWEYKAYGGGPQSSETFYDAPNQRTVWAGTWQTAINPPGLHPLGVGTWRAPAGLTNTFARESHMDVLAAKAGMDPVEFRLRNLSDKRMRRVLETAAEKFAWKPAKAPSGRGVGVSCGMYTGTYMAVMAEVSVQCADGYSGWFGVASSGRQPVCWTVAGFPSSNPGTGPKPSAVTAVGSIAVMGRQNR